MIAGRACRRHRPALVDLVDHGERGPGLAAALDHLDACPRCVRELTELALTVAALRRAGSTYRSLPVPAMAPPAVVRRPAARPGAAWSWRLQLGSLAAGAAVVALLVAPRAGLLPERPIAEAVPVRPAAVPIWQSAERQIAVRPDAAPVAVVVLPPRYPEGVARPWKEVPDSDAAVHELLPS